MNPNIKSIEDVSPLLENWDPVVRFPIQDACYYRPFPLLTSCKKVIKLSANAADVCKPVLTIVDLATKQMSERCVTIQTEGTPQK